MNTKFLSYFLTLVILVLGWTSPRNTYAIDYVIEGGPHLAFWPMSVQLQHEVHDGFGFGMGGRASFVIGPYFRTRVGYLPGKFTDEDQSEVERNLITLDFEALFRNSVRTFWGIGFKFGADHISILEVLETYNDSSRRNIEQDAWGFAMIPYCIMGYNLSERIRLELESSFVISFVNNQIRTSIVFVLGIIFPFQIGGSHQENVEEQDNASDNL